MEREEGEEESYLWYPLSHHEKKQSKRPCTAIPHAASSILYSICNVDRRWRLRVVSSFGRKTQRLPDDIVPRGGQGTSGGRGETVTGTGVGAGTGGRKRVRE